MFPTTCWYPLSQAWAYRCANYATQCIGSNDRKNRTCMVTGDTTSTPSEIETAPTRKERMDTASALDLSNNTTRRAYDCPVKSPEAWKTRSVAPFSRCMICMEQRKEKTVNKNPKKNKKLFDEAVVRVSSSEGRREFQGENFHRLGIFGWVGSHRRRLEYPQQISYHPNFSQLCVSWEGCYTPYEPLAMLPRRIDTPGNA